MSGTTSNGPSIVGPNSLSTPLMSLLMVDEIQPGSEPSYQICKTIYTDHPLGAKIADKPIQMAQSKPREIAVPGAPDSAVAEFQKAWKALQADHYISALHSTARIYGIATLAVGETGGSNDAPIDPENMADADLYFNVFDPLNTSGSLVLDQNPNSPDFQKVDIVSVAGERYHRSRTVVAMNGRPIYIDYTNSAFGYTGRSVYQAALYPLKSFVQTMITDDMVSRKAGLLIAKIKQPGSIINNLMASIGNAKRALLQQAATNNVLSIDITESIETLNMMNIDGAGKFARDNILKNIAAAVPMPAAWLNEETLAEGFGEGSEDARAQERYVTHMREAMAEAYAFFDEIAMRKAWTPAFYATVQAKYPEQFEGMEFKEAFYAWKNAFHAEWPSLIEEPPSEQSKTEKVKFDAITGVLTVMLPQCDPENKARLFEWAAENMNQQKLLFPHPLVLDYEALATYEPPAPEGEADTKADSVKRPRRVA